jgi:myo-inositol-1(or 4)-monophosphatase
MMDAIVEYIRVCEEAVRAGGAVVQEWVGRFDVREKGPADLVTQADVASQETVRRVVLGAFPDHFLLGEETGDCPNFRPSENGTVPLSAQGDSPVLADTRTGTVPLASGTCRWIVDPLDGTTNYVHRLPHYAVSLALERDGQVLVGAVYDPCRDECFTATLGGGAHLNGRPIRVSGVARLADALAVCGFPPHLQPDSPDLRVFQKAIFHCQAVRRSGCSSLNLCYLAAGRYDTYWSFGTKVWDVAAGTLIVREAGGIVTAPDGGPFVLDSGQFLAAPTAALHEELRALVASVLA